MEQVKNIPFKIDNKEKNIKVISPNKIKQKFRINKWFLDNKEDIELFYNLTIRFFQLNDIEINNFKIFKEEFILFMYKSSYF